MTPRSIQRCLLWLTLTGLVIIVVIMGLTVSIFGVEGLNTGVHQLKSLFLGWRVLVFLVLIGGWPIWVATVANRGWIDANRHAELSSYRWYFALWLLLLELFFNQGLLSHLVNLILETS